MTVTKTTMPPGDPVYEIDLRAPVIVMVLVATAIPIELPRARAFGA